MEVGGQQAVEQAGLELEVDLERQLAVPSGAASKRQRFVRRRNGPLIRSTSMRQRRLVQPHPGGEALVDHREADLRLGVEPGDSPAPSRRFQVRSRVTHGTNCG